MQLLDKMRQPINIGDMVFYSHSYRGIGIHTGYVVDMTGKRISVSYRTTNGIVDYVHKIKSQDNILVISPKLYPELFI